MTWFSQVFFLCSISKLFSKDATPSGSFTGSVDKAGLFEEADNGTLFLDEINSMSLNMQSKLLRVLETSTLRRVCQSGRGKEEAVLAGEEERFWHGTQASAS